MLKSTVLGAVLIVLLFATAAQAKRNKGPLFTGPDAPQLVRVNNAPPKPEKDFSPPEKVCDLILDNHKRLLKHGLVCDETKSGILLRPRDVSPLQQARFSREAIHMVGWFASKELIDPDTLFLIPQTDLRNHCRIINGKVAGSAFTLVESGSSLSQVATDIFSKVTAEACQSSLAHAH